MSWKIKKKKFVYMVFCVYVYILVFMYIFKWRCYLKMKEDVNNEVIFFED